MAFKHGVNGYTNFRCRCEVCRFAWNLEYKRKERNRKARGLPDSDPRHGKYTTYRNWCCRCRRCCDAWAKYNRDRKASEATR